MKTSLLMFIIFNLLCSFFLYNSKSLKSKSQKKDDPPTDVYSFADGTDGGNNLRNDADYIKPTVVDDLKKEKLLDYDPESAVADEKESIKNYYDGEMNLNVVELRCHNFKSSKNCYNISHCGWCGSSNSCVEGNRDGPIGNCKDKHTYIFGK